jgi:hypothetical protein
MIADIPLWKKKSWKGLRDSRDSIVKEKIVKRASWQPRFHYERKNREKGFLIARIPSWKKKKFRMKGFLIARILSWKQEQFVKRLCDSQRHRESLNPTIKGIPTEKAWDNNKLWHKSHRQRNSHRKAWDNNKLCPKSHRQRDSHRKGLRQQQVVA